MPDDGELIPERPRSAGVVEEAPEPGGLEGAHVLADQARAHLRATRFTDEQIDAWADAYIAEEHSGDVAGFVAWLGRLEHLRASACATYDAGHRPSPEAP